MINSEKLKLNRLLYAKEILCDFCPLEQKMTGDCLTCQVQTLMDLAILEYQDYKELYE